jgi:hypothetical protein
MDVKKRECNCKERTAFKGPKTLRCRNASGAVGQRDMSLGKVVVVGVNLVVVMLMEQIAD